MNPEILLGCSDFLSLREEGAYYIDKTGFISSVLRAPAQVQLYPRPRRFGKTLNLSTLRYFLERGPDRTALYSDLAVWKDERARKHFQRYPVITLSFKDVKQLRWEDARKEMARVVADAVSYHRDILANEAIDIDLRKRIAALKQPDMDPANALHDLSQALHQHHGEKVVILIDEYDSPILTGWQYGYYDDVTNWFRGFLSRGLKDNASLFRGVLTGILRVGKESMFSGLKNLRVYSLLQCEMPEPFGLLQEEVDQALRAFGREGEAETVRAWYNGYHFGESTVHNPWSILSFLSAPRAKAQPWWMETADNTPVRDLLLRHAELNADFAILLQGGTVEKVVEENMVLRDMVPNNLWSYLLFLGYLTLKGHHTDEWGAIHAHLQIPNREVRSLWRGTFYNWIQQLPGNPTDLQHAILAGDAPKTELLLTELLRRHVSVHDVTETQDEAFYHAFVLGMLVSLEPTHRVRSNRESGLGRADLLLIPKKEGLPGVVLEFKRRKGAATLEQLAEDALKQIQAKDYSRELEGATVVHRLRVAFSGKEIVVRGEER